MIIESILLFFTMWFTPLTERGCKAQTRNRSPGSGTDTDRALAMLVFSIMSKIRRLPGASHNSRHDIPNRQPRFIGVIDTGSDRYSTSWSIDASYLWQCYMYERSEHVNGRAQLHSLFQHRHDLHFGLLASDSLEPDVRTFSASEGLPGSLAQPYYRNSCRTGGASWSAIRFFSGSAVPTTW